MGRVTFHNKTRGGVWAPNGLDVEIKVTEGGILFGRTLNLPVDGTVTIDPKTFKTSFELSSKTVRGFKKTRLVAPSGKRVADTNVYVVQAKNWFGFDWNPSALPGAGGALAGRGSVGA